MAGKKNELGPTGVVAAENVKRIREKLRLTFAELSRILEESGRAIPPLGLRRIEEGERRIDADDLVALSLALGVSPATLLMPDTDSEDARVSVTGHPDTVPASQLWRWLRADRSIAGAENAGELVDFYTLALPAWRRMQVADFLQDMADLNAGGERARALFDKHKEAAGLTDADWPRGGDGQ